MDALALLCTLHADGPATLKRLRARGYSDLVTLIQRSANDLSADLDVEPAFARRLLREAKLLAVRVGAEGLEAEEAPPIVTATDPEGDSAGAERASVDLPPSIPIAAPTAGDMASTLDASDRSLVERIVAAPKLEEADLVPGEPVVAQPVAAEPMRVEPTRVEPVPAQPDPVVSDARDAAPEKASAPTVEPLEAERHEAGSLEAAALPGLDSDLIFDLKASGISTLEQLAAADSLELTRSLGVTFAQARRLGFLARRAAAAVEAPAAATHSAATHSAGTRSAGTRSIGNGSTGTPPAVAQAPEPAKPAAEVTLPEVTLAPRRRAAAVSAPTPAPAAPEVAEPQPEPEADATAGVVAGNTDAHDERKPFWEPREFLTGSTETKVEPEQGVKVDPAEIAPRPRFGDRLAKAAEDERRRASRADAASGGGDSSAKTILGWNFEIPRPEEEPTLPLGSLSVPDEGTPEQGIPSPSTHGDQDRGGPFA